MQSINLILYFSFKKLQLDTIFDASSYVSTNSPTVQPVWSKRDFNSFCKVSISHSLWIYWTIYTQFEKHATWIIKFGLMTDLLVGANLVCVFALFIWEIFFAHFWPRKFFAEVLTATYFVVFSFFVKFVDSLHIRQCYNFCIKTKVLVLINLHKFLLI